MVKMRNDYKPKTSENMETKTPEEVVETTENTAETTETVTEDVSAPVTPVIEETKPEVKPVVINEPAKQMTPVSAVEKAFNSQVNTLRAFAQVFAEYADHLAPGKPVEDNVGGRLQYRLWTAFQTLINNTAPGEFKAVWNNVLAISLEHKAGVFNEYLMFRFTDQWQQAPDTLRAYNSLLNLILITADPNARQAALKQVNLDYALALGYTEQGRGNLINFYRT